MLSPVLLQLANGNGEVKRLPGPFLPTMVTSEGGVIRTFRFVDFIYGETGERCYTYVEDETLRLPVTHPSEVEANAGEEVRVVPDAGEGVNGGVGAEAGSGDRDAPGSGEV